MNLDLNQIIERRGTSSVKWDATEALFGEKDLLPMWVADMDFPVAESIVNAVNERAKHPVFGYNTISESTYQAVRHWLSHRHNWQTEKEWIVFTPGVVPAISSIINTYTEPGDQIIVQKPVYYPFFGMIEKNNRKVVNNPLVLRDGTYEIDFDDLEQKLQGGAKMIILSNPHNPVGRVWREDELRRLGELCLAHNVLIVSDDIHFDLIYPGSKHTILASLSEKLAQQTITCVAPSKTFNLAGLQTSSIIIPNERLRKQFNDQLAAQGIQMINTFGPLALEAAYFEGEAWLEAVLDYLTENLQFLKSFIRERLPEIKVIEPEGTYLVWMDLRDLGLEHKQLEELMQKTGKIALDEGYIFGEEGKGFERINIACPRSLLSEGLERIEKAIRTIRPLA